MEFQLIAPQKDCSALEQIFYNRGFKTLTGINHYLNTDERDIIDPLKLDNIQEGAKMLISHIYQNNDILLQIDSDTDGFTSSAILMNYLNRLFPIFVQNHIHYWVHDSKAHGIDEGGISDNIKLVIAPDSSSNEFNKHKELAEKGIDILVIDHHNAPKISEYACIINNQLCGYPNKSLSGAGMVYKFCSYIDKLLETDYAKNYLDLTSLGMIADVVSLTDFETRQIINVGLKNIRNPFLKAIINSDERYFPKDKPISVKSIAWSIAPLVNAITRVGSIEEKQLLFESMLEFKAYNKIPSTKRGCKGQMETIVEQALRTCRNVKSKQDKSRDSLFEKVVNIIDKENLLDNKILAIKIEETSPIIKNITGLVANKIMSKYQRPVLLLNKNYDNNQILWTGSGRSFEINELPSLQKFLINSNLVEFAEGHDSAFGVSIKEENFNKLMDYANEELKNVNFITKYNVDLIYDKECNVLGDIYSIAQLKHIWGQGISEPLIAFTNIKLTRENLHLMGAKKNTWKIEMNNFFSFIKFNSSEEEFEDLIEPYGHIVVDIVGTCEINDWNDSPQIYIVDYNVVKRQKYDF